MEKSLLLQEQIKNSSLSVSHPYNGKLINLRLEKIGLSKTLEIIEHRGASVIIPKTSKGSLIFVKQYRRAADRVLLEFPAGMLENKEDPLTCAQRELQEEIGFKSLKMTPLGGVFPNPGLCTEYIHIFLAENLKKSSLEPDEDEAIDVVELSLSKALSLIDKNVIVDAKTIICLFKYLRLKNEI